MNSTMKISGYISSMLILFGAIFKFQHWPGASVMLVLGVSFLTVIFLPLLFILKFKSSAESNRSVVLSIIGFVAASFIGNGILFRIMHWPHAQGMAVIGGVLLVFGYLPIYFISIYKNTTNKINATATVILIIAGVGLLVTESRSGITREVSDSFWRGVTESEQLVSFMKKENQKCYDEMIQRSNSDSTINSSSIQSLHSKTKDLINYIEDLKTHLIASTEGIFETVADTIHLDELRTSGGADIINSIVFGNGEYTVAMLKNKLDDYKIFIQEISNDTDVSILETISLNVYGEKVPWEQANFANLPIPLVVFNLIRMQLAVNSIESSLLNKIK